MKRGQLKAIVGAFVVTTVLVSTYAGNISNVNSPEAGGLQTQVDTTAKDDIEIVGTPTSDDPWNEMAKLVDEYYAKSGMEYAGILKLIDDNSETETVLEEHDFNYTLLSESYYHYTMGDVEVVSKPKFIMTANRSSKTIHMSRNFPVNPISLFDINNFKKAMEERGARAAVTQSGDEKIITIDQIQDVNIQGYRVYYSPQTHKINKLLIGMVRLNSLEEDSENEDLSQESEGVNEYYYYLEVTFKSARKLSINEKSFHPEKKYITINNGQVELAPESSDYELLNTIAL